MKDLVFNTLSDIINIFRENRFSQWIVCPHCNSKDIIKNGKYKGKQRYICKKCSKSFNDFTASPLSMTHFPEKWPLFMKCTIEGLSLRQAAVVLGISYVTLFYWRHKLLIALKEISIGALDNLIESDDTFLAYSEKGKRNIKGREPKKRGEKCILFCDKKVIVLMISDRSKKLITNATLSSKFNCKYINDVIGNYVTRQTVLCSNLKPQYCSFARFKKIKHYRILNKNKQSIYNIKSAGNYIKKFKEWMLTFKGVASKYLNSYLSLYRFLSSINFDKSTAGVKEFLSVISTEYVYKSNSAVTDQDFAAA